MGMARVHQASVLIWWMRTLQGNHSSSTKSGLGSDGVCCVPCPSHAPPCAVWASAQPVQGGLQPTTLPSTLVCPALI